MTEPRRTSAAEMLRINSSSEGPLVAVTSGWERLSVRYTDEARRRATRADLTVAVAPGAPHGAPGCFVPDLSTILLDGEILPALPELLDTDDEVHREALAVLHGVFLHEVGHAMHTTVVLLPRTSPLGDAVALLEEIRMESQATRDDPTTATWLRAAARKLIVADHSGVDGLAALAAATLTEGRVVAGSLEPGDIQPIRASLDAALPKSTRETLRELWHEAIAIPDGRLEPLLAAADRMVALAASAPVDAVAVRDLAEALGTTARRASRSAAGEVEDLLDDGPVATVRTAVAGLRRGDPALPHRIGRQTAPTRAPTDAERHARAQLARALEQATRTARVVIDGDAPPGRLRGAAAVRAAADRARGAPPAAQPFRRPAKRRTSREPLRVAVAIDLSGSMAAAAGPLASAAWVAAGAVRDIGGAAVAVGFDEKARVLIPAAGKAALLPDLRAVGRTERVTDALALAVKELGSHAPVDLILLASDGHWTEAEAETADAELERLQASGTRVVHLAIGRWPYPHPADETIVLDEIASLAPTIGRACVRALRD